MIFQRSLAVTQCPVHVLIFQVLKIFVHLCGHGSNHFLTELRRNSTFIQQASGETLCCKLHVTLMMLSLPFQLDTHSMYVVFDFEVYSGPPDPIHGTALYQKVRNTAQVRCRLYFTHRVKHSICVILAVALDLYFFYLQEVARLLFTDTFSTKSGISPLSVGPPAMGEL